MLEKFVIPAAGVQLVSAPRHASDKVSVSAVRIPGEKDAKIARVAGFFKHIFHTHVINNAALFWIKPI